MVRAYQHHAGLLVGPRRSSSRYVGRRGAAGPFACARSERLCIRLEGNRGRKIVEDGARGCAKRARGMTKIIIDGKEIDVPPEYTLLQACEAAGAEIPRFCYHERLSIAGNCRMCLVEVAGSPKPVASCA